MYRTRLVVHRSVEEDICHVSKCPSSDINSHCNAIKYGNECLARMNKIPSKLKLGKRLIEIVCVNLVAKTQVREVVSGLIFSPGRYVIFKA